MFNLFGRSKPKGLIAYFGLEDWWLTTFSGEERKHIVGVTSPGNNAGFGIDLVGEDIGLTSATIPGIFGAVAGWFKSEKDRTIAYRFLEKALQEKEKVSDITELHFLYQACIETYYRFRDIDNSAYAKAKDFCLKQININRQVAEHMKEEYPDEPLPLHIGFKQLTIILDKEGKQEEAIKYAKQAFDAGWSGDWKKRIERYKKKL